MLATSIMRLRCSRGCEPAQAVDNPALARIETVPPVVGHRKEGRAAPLADLMRCRHSSSEESSPMNLASNACIVGETSQRQRETGPCRGVVPGAWMMLLLSFGSLDHVGSNSVAATIAVLHHAESRRALWRIAIVTVSRSRDAIAGDDCRSVGRVRRPRDAEVNYSS